MQEEQIKKIIAQRGSNKVEKAASEWHFKKFNRHGFYFVSLTYLIYCKTWLVPYNATICSLEKLHFHDNLSKEELVTTQKVR